MTPEQADEWVVAMSADIVAEIRSMSRPDWSDGSANCRRQPSTESWVERTLFQWSRSVGCAGEPPGLQGTPPVKWPTVSTPAGAMARGIARSVVRPRVPRWSLPAPLSAPRPSAPFPAPVSPANSSPEN